MGYKKGVNNSQQSCVRWTLQRQIDKQFPPDYRNKIFIDVISNPSRGPDFKIYLHLPSGTTYWDLIGRRREKADTTTLLAVGEHKQDGQYVGEELTNQSVDILFLTTHVDCRGWPE